MWQVSSASMLWQMSVEMNFREMRCEDVTRINRI